MCRAALRAQRLNWRTGLVGDLLARLLGEACGRLRSLREVGDAPDLADDTFLLAGRALHYAPALVLQQPALLPALLDASAAGLLVQHRWRPSVAPRMPSSLSVSAVGSLFVTQCCC